LFAVSGAYEFMSGQGARQAIAETVCQLVSSALPGETRGFLTAACPDVLLNPQGPDLKAYLTRRLNADV